MNCWRNVTDKFNISPEDAEKEVMNNRLLLFSVITCTAITWKPVDRWDLQDC